MIEFTDFERLTDTEWRQHVESINGMFIAEGFTTIERALAAGHVPRSAITSPRWERQLHELGISPERIITRDEAQIEQLTGYHVHRGALVAFERPREISASTLLAPAQRILVLEDVLDHTNVGAIMRVAAAFAFDAILLTPNTADPLYRRAIKVSMGTVFTLRWARDPDPLARLHERNIRTFALTPNINAVDLRTLDPTHRHAPFALILGTEGDGLRTPTLAAATTTVRIPMAAGVDSLNVAAAAAVACYELTR